MSDPADDSCDLDALPVGVLVHVGGVIERVNARAQEILGADAERIVGRGLNSFLPPQEAARLLDRYRRRVRGEAVPAEYECTVLRPDGRHRRAEVTVTLRGVRAFVALRDITERTVDRDRRLALAHLGASLHLRDHEEAVYQALRGGIADIGLSCALLDTSESRPSAVFVDIPGAVRDALAGQLGAELLTLRGRWSPGLEDAMRWGESYVDDVPAEAAVIAGDAVGELLRSLGPAVPPRAVLARLDREGGGRSVLAVLGAWICEDDLAVVRLLVSQLTTALDNVRALDAARRKEREAEAVTHLARALLEAASESTARVLEVASEHMARALSARSAEVLLLDEDGAALRAPGSRGEVPLDEAPLARDVLSRGEAATISDTSLDPRAGRLDREERSLAVLLVPVSSPRGCRGLVTLSDEVGRRFRGDEIALAHAMGSVVDVALENATLHVEARQRVVELSEAQAQVVQKERLAALGELAAVMAHEVRNPLGVIFNSLGALNRLVKPVPDAQVILAILREEADRLNRIVGDLLDFARPRALVTEPVAVGDLVEESARAAQVTDNQAGGVDVRVEVQAGIPMVLLDARLLRQALVNLCSNAMQAMGGAGSLRVRACVEDEALRIDVADSGPGIAEEVRARLFEPFFTTKATGTGLGLAVVRRIVEAHGGALWAECPDAGGTVFSMQIPLREG
ncbi:MAG: ATP-binding protein [Polyangiales bacterium]